MYYFVILSGGSGSRLWPKSREKLPKQFLKLTNDYTMFQNTLFRVKKITNYLENITSILEYKVLVICNQDHSHIIEYQIKEIEQDYNFDIQIICEPNGRDSAPAICIASLLGSKDDFTFILPCDHIFDDDEFSRCCIDSLKYLDDSIITFGITPTHPETGYGYIEINKNDDNYDNHDTIQFIEKPNIEKATEYFNKGTYLWNAGIFIFKNKNMISCFQNYASDILISCEKIIENINFKQFSQKKTIILDSSFSTCRAISIDYAIMENLCKETDISFTINKKTIPYKSYWNDIGSFSSLYTQLLLQNCTDDKNVIKGDILTLDTQNCYIDSEKSFIATIGIDNMVIINTHDALLVCHKDKSQEVKKIVDYLKKNNREEAMYHTKVYRPWGFYINIEGNNHSGFKVKRIAVYPGKRLSLQSHNYRSEHWVIVKGNGKVQLGVEEIFLQKDQNIYIPIKTLHRIENVGTELLEFTETQIGDYLGEDDIIRYEDDFGRV
jgi:mannose-1-phosphate guanylyltransferase/mannose-6-phosphate isomerase